MKSRRSFGLQMRGQPRFAEFGTKRGGHMRLDGKVLLPCRISGDRAVRSVGHRIRLVERRLADIPDRRIERQFDILGKRAGILRNSALDGDAPRRGVRIARVEEPCAIGVKDLADPLDDPGDHHFNVGRLLDDLGDLLHRFHVGQRGPPGFLQPLALQGGGDDFPDHLQEANVRFGPAFLRPDRIEADKSDQGPAVGDRDGEDRPDVILFEDRFFGRRFGREVGDPGDVDAFESAELIHPPGKGVAGNPFEMIDDRCDPFRAPFVGVLEFGSLIDKKEEIAAVDAGEFSDCLKRPADRAIGFLGGKVNEVRGDRRDLLFNADSMLKGFLRLESFGQLNRPLWKRTGSAPILQCRNLKKSTPSYHGFFIGSTFKCVMPQRGAFLQELKKGSGAATGCVYFRSARSEN